MRSFIWIAFLGSIILFSSCKKCKRCHYTYTVTKIEQTPNGEVTVIDTLRGNIINEEGELFQEECVKKNEAQTIEAAYQFEEINTDKENFKYFCEDI